MKTKSEIKSQFRAHQQDKSRSQARIGNLLSFSKPLRGLARAVESRANTLLREVLRMRILITTVLLLSARRAKHSTEMLLLAAIKTRLTYEWSSNSSLKHLKLKKLRSLTKKPRGRSVSWMKKTDWTNSGARLSLTNSTSKPWTMKSFPSRIRRTSWPTRCAWWWNLGIRTPLK